MPEEQGLIVTHRVFGGIWSWKKGLPTKHVPWSGELNSKGRRFYILVHTMHPEIVEDQFTQERKIHESCLIEMFEDEEGKRVSVYCNKEEDKDYCNKTLVERWYHMLMDYDTIYAPYCQLLVKSDQIREIKKRIWLQ